MNQSLHSVLPTISILIGLLFLHSCHPSPLETALEKAGTNRTELEEVLTHFGRSPEDSLKYKAARFLIENMPGHTSLREQRATEYFDSLSQHSTSDNWIEWKLTEQMYLRHVNLFDENSPLTEDVETLTARQLIDYIESVFRQRASCPWLQEITFDTFCEYLLPYHLYKERTLFYRDSIPRKLLKTIEHIRIYDNCRTNITPIGRQLYSKYPLPYFEAMKKLPKHIADHHSDCRDNALGELLLYRTAGIPAALDMIPAWGNNDGNHAWAHPIDARFHSREEIENFNREIPKVYRQTYSKQKDIKAGQGEFIPPFFRDAFLKDVTDEYVNTTTVTENNFPRNVRYGYLCVFNELEWKPVAQADNRKGTCTFDRVGTNCLYLPVYYENGLPVPTAAPFIIKSNGDKQRIEHQDSPTTELVLYRKYPLEIRKEHYFRPFNCLVEGSNTPDFHHCDTLGCAVDHHPTTAFQVFPKGKYRFIRLSPLPGKTCRLAEVYFKDINQANVAGKADREKIGYFPTKNITDSNILSSLILSDKLVYSFAQDSLPESIHLLPANDGNGIYPGDEYELFCFNFSEGWISCGTQKADDYRLTFRNVPRNTLFWLQNHTNGKEERIFTYENGTQRFW